MPSPASHSNSPFSRFEGALLGLAGGDALGAPVEFLPRREVARRHGRLTEMVGGGSGRWAPGEWTDDTAQALAVAGGILAAPEDPIVAIGQGFLEWADAGPKDIGETTRQAFDAFRRKGDWHLGAASLPLARAGRAAGNGSLMRTLPVALAYPDVETMLRQSARISGMTHWDPMAETCCAIHCLWVRAILRGATLAEGWHRALEQARRIAAEATSFPPPAQAAGWIAADHPAWERLSGVERLSEERIQPDDKYAGYSLDCLEAAAWCALRTSSYEEAMVTAVNLGQESDTIAAVAGGPTGAFYGGGTIPERWLGVLKDREELTAVAVRLAELRHRRVYATDGLRDNPFWVRDLGDGLLHGRNPLTEVDVAELVDRGVTHVLDLREESEWTSDEKKQKDRFGAEAVAAMKLAGIQRRHVPITDVSAPFASALDGAVGFLATARESQAYPRIFVHCRAGRERTGAVLVAHAVRSRGISVEAAVRELQKRSASIAPLGHQLEAVEDWLRGS